MRIILKIKDRKSKTTPKLKAKSKEDPVDKSTKGTMKLTGDSIKLGTIQSNEGLADINSFTKEINKAKKPLTRKDKSARKTRLKHKFVTVMK